MAQAPVTNPLPLTFRTIEAKLRGRIGRQWRPGDRLPPIGELAQMLGAGQVNTHRAVRELVKKGLLQSRRKLGTFVTPGAASGALETAVARSQPAAVATEPLAQRLHARDAGRRHTPSLRAKRVTILAGGKDAFLAPAMQIIHDRLAAQEAEVGSRFFELGAYEATVADCQQDDALVLVNVPMLRTPPTRPGQALLFIDTALGPDILHGLRSRYDLVNVDSTLGAREAGQHLREIGCREIAFLGCPAVPGGSQYDAISSERLRGCEAGFGAAVAPAHRLVAPQYRMDAGARAFNAYMQLASRPRAIVAASDDLAMGLVYGAMAHGMTAGEDVMVVGFDGQVRGKQLPGGPLTSVEAPILDLGREAARLLADRIMHPDRPIRRVELCGHLFKGATTQTSSSCTVPGQFAGDPSHPSQEERS